MSSNCVQQYGLKMGRYSSHSVILAMIGRGNGRVLDVGCGDGHLSAQIRSLGWYVVGLENHTISVDRAQSICDRIIVVDLNKFDAPVLAEDSFDIVICGDVLEHLVDPLTTLKLLIERLKPEGQLIISVPNVAHAWVRLNLMFGRFEYTAQGILDRTHTRFFTRRSLIRLVTDAGLDVLVVRTTPVPIEEIFKITQPGRILFFLQPIGALLSRLLPRLLAYQFVIRAKPRVT